MTLPNLDLKSRVTLLEVSTKHHFEEFNLLNLNLENRNMLETQILSGIVNSLNEF